MGIRKYLAIAGLLAACAGSVQQISVQQPKKQVPQEYMCKKEPSRKKLLEQDRMVFNFTNKNYSLVFYAANEPDSSVLLLYDGMKKITSLTVQGVGHLSYTSQDVLRYRDAKTGTYLTYLGQQEGERMKNQFAPYLKKLNAHEHHRVWNNFFFTKILEGRELTYTNSGFSMRSYSLFLKSSFPKKKDVLDVKTESKLEVCVRKREDDYFCGNKDFERILYPGKSCVFTSLGKKSKTYIKGKQFLSKTQERYDVPLFLNLWKSSIFNKK